MRTLALASTFLPILVSGCGDDGGTSTVDAAVIDAAPGAVDAAATFDAGAPDGATAADAGAFTLTSPVLSEGEMFPDTYACVGANISPPLAWTNPPAGTQSFAIVFRDLDFMGGFIHWVIWDIPAGTTSLPEDVAKQANPPEPAGSRQCRSYDGATYGYLGPCSGGSINTYQLTLYALDVATLPDVTTDSARAAVAAEIDAHVIDTATLSGEH